MNVKKCFASLTIETVQRDSYKHSFYSRFFAYFNTNITHASYNCNVLEAFEVFISNGSFLSFAKFLQNGSRTDSWYFTKMHYSFSQEYKRSQFYSSVVQ